MNSAIITIFKKEIARFLGDKKTVFGTILLPGLMIYLMYTFMGSAFESQFGGDDLNAACYVENLPASLEQVFHALPDGVEIKEPGEKKEEIKEGIAEQEEKLLVIFPEDFDRQVKTAGKEVPQVGIYYNSSDHTSEALYMQVTEMLDSYESSISNLFDINKDEGESWDLASEEDTMAQIFATMMPMLLMAFLFSGTLAVAPESIAGEKERGTIATLLVTPIKRGHIAVGKVLALSVISVLSGLSSTVGTILSLPKMVGEDAEISGNVYVASDYFLLGVIILSTVLLLVTAISLISAWAKSIKEAQTFASPLLIVVMLVGISAMFGGDVKTDWYYYCIPLYNSVQYMVGIFQFEADVMAMLVTVGSNLLYTLIGVWGITKMFQSEKIVFDR